MERMEIKNIALIMVVLVLVGSLNGSLVLSKPDLQNQIIGTWYGLNTPNIIEFYKDGTYESFKQRYGDAAYGEYTFTDPNHIRLRQIPGLTIVYKISIKNDQLTLVSPSGRTLKFKRM